MGQNKKDIEKIILSHKSLIEKKILNESLEKEKIDIDGNMSF